MGSKLARIGKPQHFPELVRRHNLLMLYTYLAYLWGTGARPVRDGIPELDDIVTAHSSMWVRIVDKHNRSHLEARCVMCPPVLQYLLSQLLVHRSEVQLILRQRGIYPDGEMTDQTLFTFVLDNRLVPLSPARVRAVLVQEDLEKCYPYPLNCHRHYLETHALATRFPFDQLEPQLGHVHPGRDRLDPYSTAPLLTACRPAMEYGETVLRALGVRKLRPLLW
jgi:hypothetical protein